VVQKSMYSGTGREARRNDVFDEVIQRCGLLQRAMKSPLSHGPLKRATPMKKCRVPFMAPFHRCRRMQNRHRRKILLCNCTCDLLLPAGPVVNPFRLRKSGELNRAKAGQTGPMRAGRVVLWNGYSVIKDRRPNGPDRIATRLYIYWWCCAAESPEAKQTRKIVRILQIIRGDLNFLCFAWRLTLSAHRIV